MSNISGTPIYTETISSVKTINASDGLNFLSIKPASGASCTVLGTKKVDGVVNAVTLGEGEPLNIVSKNNEPLDGITITPTGNVSLAGS